ncbi:receptor-like protein kinase HSL1 [Phoenix dactylifera]|uniref:non-specific serine/threonine protein kinase n=1 Tax=Phoenix dactylifera TaxID=42345 RepID=A0A8B7BQE5_PHODC|nr:receptor-like protein kinase HSL1 [Phoenix dactylifera]
MRLLRVFFLFFHLLHTSFSLNQEGLYLLEAKRGLDDPDNALSNWNPRDATPCNWTGVFCSPPATPSSDPTVTSVNLSMKNLVGPFPAALCRLPSLVSLSLSSNYINSSLPDSSLRPCPSLSHLNLSINNLVGPLPAALASLPSLLSLDLSANNFSGPIPPSFADFPRLERLSLVNNLLNSTIPSFLSNVSTLRELNLSYNPLTPGPVPAKLAELRSLEQLWLADCNLIGEIPPQLGHLANLINFDLSSNSLSGPIPPSLTHLSSVVQIELYHNSLSGPIPSGFSKLANLRHIDASTNQLEGPLPEDFFDAPLLETVHFYDNQLTGSIPGHLSRASNLVDLKLFRNQLNGSLPADFGKSSPLIYLDLSDNLLSGEIPASICDHGVLQELLLIDNMFGGNLPESLGRCRALTRVRLTNNRLSGEVPAGMWGLPHLWLLELKGNSFSGGISPVISNAANLSNLVITDNQFSGGIPSEMGALSKLYEFSAANNRLTGPLPSSLGNLAQLGRLNLRNNSLSGELLRGIESWKKLSELNLAYNEFSGGIPQELGDLPVLNYLDLSNNVLTGEIPGQLQNLKLNQFNVSNNQLSGSLPPLFATQVYRSSFLGNPGLCADQPGLCPASQGGRRTRHEFFWLLRAIFMLAALVLLVGVAWFYWRYRNYRRSKLGTDRSKWTLTSFHKLGFSEYEILDCLDEDNVIGSGASGKVYKAVLGNGEAVAVKKLRGASNRDADDDVDRTVDDHFEAEVATLGKIRHKNIVKLWCCCTHKDCKLLVYEYMPKGSLGDLLHGSKGGLLDWPTRYKVAVDAAEGLSYLHHDCVPPIVHRDVKSNNILLDGEFGARVADFGVAKAVEAIGKGPKSMSIIAGSCGYIAPEYAYTLRVNEKSDIYSFGVVILELVTGRLPVDPEFGEKDLVKWVCGTIDQKGVEHVIDPKLDVCFMEEIKKVLKIGLLCTSSLPINRPSMRRVVKMLLEVSTNKPNKPEKRDGKLSPYYYENASDQGSIV